MNSLRALTWPLLFLGIAAFDVLFALGIVTFYSPTISPSYNIAFTNAYYTFIDAFGTYLPSNSLFLIVFYGWIWGTLTVLIHFTIMRRGKSIAHAVETRLPRIDYKKVTSISKYECILLFLSGILIAILIYSYRFTILPVPQGFDTPYYLYVVKLWRQDLPYSFFNVEYIRPSFFLFLYILSYCFSGSLELLFVFLPAILAIIYCLAVYFFVKSVTGDTLLAILSLNLSVMSYFIIRMSIDLYSSLLYLSVMVVFFGVTTRVMRNGRKAYILLATLLTFIAVSVHPWSWIATLFMLALFSLIRFIDRGKAYFKDFSHMVLILAPSLLLVAVELALQPSFLFLYATKWFSLPSSESFWLSYGESGILLFFAVLGMLVSLFKKDDYHRLLLSWTFAITLLILVTGYEQPYRFYILLPLGLLGAQGVYSTFALIYGTIQKRSEHQLIKYTKVLLLLGLVLPVGYSVLRVAYIAPLVYYPDYVTMEQLYVIRDSFGFSNHSTIVLVYQAPALPIEPQSDVNLRDWIKATVGDEAYYGHLLELVSGLPDAHGSVVDFRNKSIVMASRLYRITALEKAIAQRIGEEIYLLKNASLEATLQTLGSLSTLSDSSFSDWQAVNTTISANVSKTINGLEIVIKGPTQNENTDLYISRNISSYGLVLNNTSTVFLKTRSNGTSIKSILGFVYHDPQNSSSHYVKEYELPLIRSEYYTWNIISIYDEMPTDEIYLRFSNTTDSMLATQTIIVQSVVIE